MDEMTKKMLNLLDTIKTMAWIAETMAESFEERGNEKDKAYFQGSKDAFDSISGLLEDEILPKNAKPKRKKPCKA